MTEISKRAQKTLELIKKGKFYACYDPNLPATIKELVEAKLIVRAARVGMVHAAYAPAEGYIPMRIERFVDDPTYAAALVEQTGAELLAALKLAFEGLMQYPGQEKAKTFIRDVIAKAEGHAP